jgi:transcriptional regulator with XRE-family HTH domain
MGTRALDAAAVLRAAAAAEVGCTRGRPTGHAVAVSLGISPATMARAMSGRPVSLGTLLALSDGLGVPADALLARNGQ